MKKKPVRGQPLRLLLAVCGVGSAVTSPQTVLNLREMGHTVRVMLSPNAGRFVSTDSLEVFSGRKIFQSIFDRGDGILVPHVELGDECDVIVVYPASANMISRLAQGSADDLVSATILHAERPVIVVPALNPVALAKPAVERNLLQLEQDGVHVLRPIAGPSVRATDMQRVGITMASVESILALAAKLAYPRSR